MGRTTRRRGSVFHPCREWEIDGVADLRPGGAMDDRGKLYPRWMVKQVARCREVVPECSMRAEEGEGNRRPVRGQRPRVPRGDRRVSPGGPDQLIDRVGVEQPIRAIA